MAELQPPIEVLFGGPGEDDLPADLSEAYGSGLGLPGTVVYANFVGSIDGVVALRERRASSSIISGRDEGDRFVMALLRAAADVVLIGAGTLREHRGPWTAEASFPSAAAAFAELRRREGRTGHPRLAVVSASGKIEEAQAALDGALVLTTRRGEQSIPSDVRGTAEVVVLGDGDELDAGTIVGTLRERGFGRILTEGGPRLMADLLASRVVQELFLSIAPLVAGGGERPGDHSPLAPGTTFLPDERVLGTLRSARRRGSFLFLRYGLETAAE